MKCPPLSSLFDYQNGHASADEQTEILTHLARECPHCRASLKWLADVQRQTTEDKSFEFAEDATRWIVAQFRAQFTPQPRLRQIIARLIFDSFAGQPQTATRDRRHGASAATRQMLFNAEGYDVDLRFELSEDREAENLVGQILPEQADAELSGWSVRLCQNQNESARALTDASGVFRFSAVQSGVYELKIQVPEGEISLAELTTARSV